MLRWLWRIWRFFRFMILGSLLGVIFVGAFLWWQLSRNSAETFFDDPVQHFKYGSTGGEVIAGLPVGIFEAMPRMCANHLPGEGWQSLGFLYEAGMERPVGTSLRRSLGFDRIGLNCAACHVGTYRESFVSEPVIVAGMPANGLDLNGFAQFIVSCVSDEKFNPWQVENALRDARIDYSWLERKLLSWVAVPIMREAVLVLQHRFRFLGHQTAPGPGRFDTFNPEKALLNWSFEELPPSETVGLADFPSLWLQGPRAEAQMHLHWDGNNVSVEERNRSAAIGTGAVPTTFDRKSMAFIADWLQTDANAPPPYPFPVDTALSERGKPIYEQYCADCHGQNGRDFSGARVGHVTPIEEIGTDRCRLDNYTHTLAAEQGNLYAGFPKERFFSFRKTDGYANQPLDGLWLRGPYLHNGSVPTVRDLLNPSAERPAVFWRGNDVIDRTRLGFVSSVPSEDGKAYFRFETQCTGPDCPPRPPGPGAACEPGPWAGNGNWGHEGPEYGTDLSPEEKDAIVEYLKTF